MTEIIDRIESCEIPHPEFTKHLAHLERRVERAIRGGAFRIEAVIGPTRVGKSMLLNALAQKYPETKSDGSRQVPVLTVQIPPSISPVMLPSSVLQALNIPTLSRGATSGQLDRLMHDQLRLAGTRVILFEEASHVVEPGARIVARAACDWFKNTAESLGVTMILFGVPRLRKLFSSNEQLRARSSAEIVFWPYSISSTAEREAYAACVKTYIAMFEQSGWRISVPFNDIVCNSYLLSAGVIGVLSRLMQELAFQLSFEAAPRAIEWNDFVKAAACVEGVGHPSCPPFMRKSVSPMEMNQCHAYMLDANDMTPLSQEALL